MQASRTMELGHRMAKNKGLEATRTVAQARCRCQTGHTQVLLLCIRATAREGVTTSATSRRCGEANAAAYCLTDAAAT